MTIIWAYTFICTYKYFKCLKYIFLVELIHVLSMGKPSLIFAEPEIAPALSKAVFELGFQTDIVTFGNEKTEGYLHFSEFIQPTGSEESFE